MIKRQLQLTELKIAQLSVAEQQSDDKHARPHYQAIHLYGQGWAIQMIQGVTQGGESSIRHWAMPYRAEGIAGLHSKGQGKKANKLTAEQCQQIRARGSSIVRWTYA